MFRIFLYLLFLWIQIDVFQVINFLLSIVTIVTQIVNSAQNFYNGKHFYHIKIYQK